MKTSHALFFTAAFAFTLLSTAPLPAQDAPAATPAQARLDAISFLKEKVTIRGKSFAFPCPVKTLLDILGQPSRTLDLKNTIYVWDALGIYAYSPPGSGTIRSIEVDFAKQDYKFSPTGHFAGTVTTEGGVINSKTVTGDLSKIGFTSTPPVTFIWQKESGATVVMAVMTREDPPSIVSCSIDVHSETLPPAPTPPPLP